MRVQSQSVGFADDPRQVNLISYVDTGCSDAVNYSGSQPGTLGPQGSTTRTIDSDVSLGCFRHS